MGGKLSSKINLYKFYNWYNTATYTKYSKAKTMKENVYWNTY